MYKMYSGPTSALDSRFKSPAYLSMPAVSLPPWKQTVLPDLSLEKIRQKLTLSIGRDKKFTCRLIFLSRALPGATYFSLSPG